MLSFKEKLLASFVSSKAKTMSFASNTPVHFIPGVGHRTAKVLHNLGLHTAGQLNSVPEQLLIEIFGPSIRTVLQTLHLTTRKKDQKYTSTSVQHATVEVEKSNKKSLSSRIRFAAQVLSLS